MQNILQRIWQIIKKNVTYLTYRESLMSHETSCKQTVAHEADYNLSPAHEVYYQQLLGMKFTANEY